MMKKLTKALLPGQRTELLSILKARFDKNMQRHKGVEWLEVEARLLAKADNVTGSTLWSLYEMETTGGEPDVVVLPRTGDTSSLNHFMFADCSAESPKDRRSLCYDGEALEARKENKPKGSALQMASYMGIHLLAEEQYRELQQLGKFDLKTSSWIKTPEVIRELGGALFCDRRYNQVFVYHNGAESYYAARGFRGWVGV